LESFSARRTGEAKSGAVLRARRAQRGPHLAQSSGHAKRAKKKKKKKKPKKKRRKLP